MGISVKNIVVRARLEEMRLTAQRRGAILVTGQKGWEHCSTSLFTNRQFC